MVEPMEHKAHLHIHTREPFNAEPALDRLRRTYLTPVGDFYVRSHGNIPVIDPLDFRITVDGYVAQEKVLSLADLRRDFEATTVEAVMQCAGNRRADMRRVRPVSGDPWAGGAIGNADWTGVRLVDILDAAGAPTREGLHVAFTALDDCEVEGERFRYGASIEMEKARVPEVLIAFAMNGEPLLPEHGFPLRVVVPGYAGARSPKWLGRITVQDRPSDAHPQARDYKLFPPDVTAETARMEEGVTIEEMPVNAAICEPAPHAALKQGSVAIRGWACASRRGIARVDVSADGGRSWRQAELEHDAKAPWSWTLWSLEVDLAPGDHELVARAWDSAGQTQPSQPDDTWNFKGYLSAAWHRINVRVA